MLQADREQRKHASRPALAQAPVGIGPGQRKDQETGEEARHQMQAQARDAPCAAQPCGERARLRWLRLAVEDALQLFRGVRCVQSWRPMKWRAYLSSTRFIGIRMGRSAVLKSGSHAGSPQIHAPARR